MELPIYRPKAMVLVGIPHGAGSKEDIVLRPRKAFRNRPGRTEPRPTRTHAPLWWFPPLGIHEGEPLGPQPVR